jgi:uncharacterized protein YnzC (UPF0291/DUF896 family)
MATYAVMNAGAIVGWREIVDWDGYPIHKREALDEKGDGGPVLRPRVIEGSGSQEQVVIEPTQVRIVRSTPAVVVTAAHIKAEAQRRILVITGAPDLTSGIIKQLNANMRANELNDYQHSRSLTTDEQREATALRGLAAAIKAVRTKSNEIEAMSPIPTDYTADSYWT